MILDMAHYYCRYDEMCEKYKVDYVPGGATQNSVRVAQVRTT